MSLVSMNPMLHIASERQFAVGSFGVAEYHIADCLIQTAEELGLPAILMIAGRSIPEEYGDRLLRFLRMISEQASVPICLHLDHGRNFEVVRRALDNGFTSVMYDGSNLSMEENMANTAKVVEWAHAQGATVEAELGYVPGADGVADRSRFTRPEDALLFRAQTGVDALAIAFGTVHGLYKAKPDLDFDLVADIHSKLDIPLVMHGGTGTSEVDMKRLIHNGIAKVNLYTEMAVAGADAAAAQRSNPGMSGHFPAMTAAARKAVCASMVRNMKLLETQPMEL